MLAEALPDWGVNDYSDDHLILIEAAELAAGVRYYELPDGRPPETWGEASLLSRLPRGCCGGVNAPVPDKSGHVKHISGTGRTRWSVAPYGSWEVTIWRPCGPVLRARQGRVTALGRFGWRHVEALVRAAPQSGRSERADRPTHWSDLSTPTPPLPSRPLATGPGAWGVEGPRGGTRERNEIMDIQAETLTINGVEYVRADSHPEPTNYVIVRSRDQGVLSGEYVSHSGREVVLRNARQIWKYVGGLCLPDISQRGLASGSRLSVAVEGETRMLEACAILPCSPAASRSLIGWPADKAGT